MKMKSKFYTNKGFTLIEILIASAILLTISMAIGGLIQSNLKSTTYIEKKLNAMDLKTQLVILMSKNEVCTCQLNPSQLAEPEGHPLDNRPGLSFNSAVINGSEQLDLKMIKFGCGLNAPPLAKINATYGTNLEIENISIKNLVPTSQPDEWRGDWTISFKSQNGVMSLKPITVAEVFKVDPASPMGTKTISSCVGLGDASPAAQEGFCDLPWGGMIGEGKTVVAYSQAEPIGVSTICSTLQETRKCEKGTLTGSFNFQNCAAPKTETEAIQRVLKKNAGRSFSDTTITSQFDVWDAVNYKMYKADTKISATISVPSNPDSKVKFYCSIGTSHSPSGWMTSTSGGTGYYSTISDTTSASIPATPLHWSHTLQYHDSPIVMDTCDEQLVTPGLSTSWNSVYLGWIACIKSGQSGKGECLSRTITLY